jgi:succinyl-CoA synthetase alpha subunit
MKLSPAMFMPKNVIVQGITGSHGSFHTRAMVAAGTNIIAGTSPTKHGTLFDSIPVYKTITEIMKDHEVDASVIFVPAPFAKSAIFEAIDANVPLIVCITENIPQHDMLQISQHLVGKSSVLIGPNCPGVIVPGHSKLGIIPATLALPGSIGIVSRSGTLTYEIAAGLTQRGIGQRYIIGIGGDPIKGTDFIDCLELFQNDPEVNSIVMVGEIGGESELEAASYIQASIAKPVYSYIAGHTAPKGVQLGHAGAIMSSADESAAAKTSALQRAGAHIYTSITDLITAVK